MLLACCADTPLKTVLPWRRLPNANRRKRSGVQLKDKVNSYGLIECALQRKRPPAQLCDSHIAHHPPANNPSQWRNLVKFRHITAEQARTLKPKTSGPWSKKHSAAACRGPHFQHAGLVVVDTATFPFSGPMPHLNHAGARTECMCCCTCRNACRALIVKPEPGMSEPHGSPDPPPVIGHTLAASAEPKVRGR
eukprot:236387-Chlamydomonas_euryale.AAC.3